MDAVDEHDVGFLDEVHAVGGPPWCRQVCARRTYQRYSEGPELFKVKDDWVIQSVPAEYNGTMPGADTIQPAQLGVPLGVPRCNPLRVIFKNTVGFRYTKYIRRGSRLGFPIEVQIVSIII